MERKDIVLKNLAEELKFTRHEFVRINKLDLAQARIEPENEFPKLDYDKINEMSENLMNLLKQAIPSNIGDDQVSKPYGTILICSNAEPNFDLDLIAKAFKAGNKVIFHSIHNSSYTYQFLNQCWQSVLASQGHAAEHIQFPESSLEELKMLQDNGEIEVDLWVKCDEVDLEKEFLLGDFVSPP